MRSTSFLIFFILVSLVLQPMAFAVDKKVVKKAVDAINCSTAGELAELNVSAKQFSPICKKIVASDPGCLKLAPEKRMSCSSKADNAIFSSSTVGAKFFQCIKGFVWDSMKELGEFIVELIKTLIGFQIKSTKAIFSFLIDSEYREKAIKGMEKSATKASRLATAFLNSSAQYFSREFTKNLAKHPFNPTLALGETLYKPVAEFISNSVQSLMAEHVPQYQCMNGASKLHTFCKLAGDFIMPPAFLLGAIKYGVKGVQGFAASAKIANFKKAFSAMNEVKDVAATAEKIKPAAIVIKSNEALAVRANKAEARVKGKIQKAKDDELADIARASRAQSVEKEAASAQKALPAPEVQVDPKVSSLLKKVVPSITTAQMDQIAKEVSRSFGPVTNEEMSLLIERFAKQGAKKPEDISKKVKELLSLKLEHVELFKPEGLLTKKLAQESEIIKLSYLDELSRNGLPLRGKKGEFLTDAKGKVLRKKISNLSPANRRKQIEAEFKKFTEPCTR
jgi:hypothetical protein